jgi:hypothetical protein
MRGVVGGNFAAILALHESEGKGETAKKLGIIKKKLFFPCLVRSAQGDRGAEDR